MNDVELKELIFKIGDKEISLTQEEAKKLKLIFDNLFDQKIIIQKEIMPYPWYISPLEPGITTTATGSYYTFKYDNGTLTSEIKGE